MDKTESIVDLSKALVKAQSQIESAVKDAKNPFFKSTYADLSAVIEAVKKPLNTNGLAFLQLVNVDADKPFIETVLLHETGQHIISKTPVFCIKPNDPQALGSGITYSKRYALQAMLGLPTEDDDGNAASKPDTKAPAPKALTPDETKTIDDIYNRLVDVANENDLIPDKASIKNLAMSKAKRLPSTPEEIGKFVDFIVNKGNLNQVCKPRPRE